MTTFQDILDKIKNAKLMQQYTSNKQNMTNPTGFGQSISNLGMNLSQSSNPMISKLGVGTQTLGNNLGALGNAGAFGNATGALGNTETLSNGLGALSSGISKAAPAATALGKATPFLGAGISGAQAAQDAKNGDYIGAGLNGISAGASFVPGIGTAVSMGASMLDSINKMFRGAQDRANAEAMKKSMEGAQKSEQANAQDTAQLQNQFANDSMNYANNMAQNDIYEDIMRNLSPSSTSDSLSTVNSNLGINTPSDIQTPQNEDYIEGLPTGGAAPVNASLGTKIRGLFNKNIKPSQIMDDGSGGAIIDKEATKTLASKYQEPKESLLERIRNGLSQFKAGYDDNSMNGFSQGDLALKLSGNSSQPISNNISNAIADAQAQGFNEQQIADMKQGLNGGNKDIAALIDKYSINKPITEEEIALAKNGEFNNNGVLTGGAAETKKTLMNRIGEAAGTGRRLMANPWVQAGIAAGISKADGGDIGDMAQAAYKYGTAKAMSDQYYKMMNPDAKVMPVLNTYGAEDYKAKAYNDFNLGRSVITRRQLLKLQNPDKSDIEIDAMAKAQGIDPDEPISIKGYETVVKGKQKDRDLDIKADKNQWQKNQGQQKIGIQAKNANTNAGRLGETIRHNGVTEAQGAERNKIASEKAKNQGNKNNSNNGSAPEGTIITNPTTGKRQVKRNGKWVDIK